MVYALCENTQHERLRFKHRFFPGHAVHLHTGNINNLGNPPTVQFLFELYAEVHVTRYGNSNKAVKSTVTVYTEDEFIQLSSLQHYVFCPRQCALIHVEDVWNENLYTIRGALLHEKVDTDTYETRGAVKTVRGLKIRSFRLGIAGRCDVVEFYKADDETGHPEVLPVEFKSGQPKSNISDEVQLCAQALCLEEMLNTTIKRGAFFYGKIRRRVRVEITAQLRSQTENIIASVHDLISRKNVPQAPYERKCATCSLLDICQPKAMNRRKLSSYLKGLYES